MDIRKTEGYTRSLYKPIEPYNTGFLKVSDLHTIYYEESGNKEGKPALYLHGGPGDGTLPFNRRLFDPESYRIILVDQRGSGKSTPAGELRENNTKEVVDDLERLRKHLDIDKWLVIGGSWGATLTLLYAEAYPDSIRALVVWGIFFMATSEIDWLCKEGGAENMFPDGWEKFIAPIPENERGDMVKAYYKRLTGDDEEEKARLAQIWCKWELPMWNMYLDPDIMKLTDDPKWCLQFARIESHFFVNHGWYRSDDQILEDVVKIRNIPAVIIQGRYDLCCPMKTSWKLHRAWPEAEYQIVPDAAHLESEPGTTHYIIQATDKFKTL